MNIEKILDTMQYGPAPESRSAADAWLARNGGGFGHFIGGQWVAGATGETGAPGETFDSINPADGQKLATLAQGNAGDIDAAVAAARAAQGPWAAIGGAARARYLYALARAVQKHSRLLSTVESLDNGKPIRESRDIDIPLVARHFYHHAGWAQLLESEFAGQVALGVVGQIIPWNFPALMLAWKIAPALATGNSVVLKPAEYTPLTALVFADICIDAGLPPGVVNIVTGDGRTGANLVEHRDIDKIAFTGSTEVGRKIRIATAGRAVKLSLELGGKSPIIVFDDADLDSAVEGVVDAIWFNQGQVCCAGSRLLVHEGVADAMVAKLKTRMGTLRIGDPLDKAIDIGAIIHPDQRARIESLVSASAGEGIEIWQPDGAMPDGGCFYPPTLLTNVTPSATVAQEEIFGPVLAVMTFRTPGEAVQLANNTRYGLASSVWTENINLALDIAPKIRAGIVWVNCTNQFDAACGFGGVRESGFGREGGREGLGEYLRPGFLSDLPVREVPAPVTRNHDLDTLPAIDRTPKHYIGGKQARPDGGYSRDVLSPKGGLLGVVGQGNAKDIRNAVEAAAKAGGWARATGHARAQILYYIAENLSARAGEFAARLAAMSGATPKRAMREVEASISRLFTYGAWADKFDGHVHSPPMRAVALAMHEPVGVIGIACPPEAPLLALISLIAPAISMGNTVVVIPSAVAPLAATDFIQVLETSDLPAGVVNIVTGATDALAITLADHANVDAVWYAGTADGSGAVEAAAADNLKRSWVDYGRRRDWFDVTQGEGREFLTHAVEVKNIWVPYGE